MKRLGKIVAAALFSVGALAMTSCGKKEGQNTSGEASGKGKLNIEPDAKIRLGLDNDNWGRAVVELWNATYPEYAGVIEFSNMGAAGATDVIGLQQGDAPDVCFVVDGELSRQLQSLSDLPEAIANVAAKVSQEPFYSNANKNKTCYVPIAYDGMAFSWNKTMMEALGMDTTDANNDGLPDAYDTWEKIFAWSASLKKRPVYKDKEINVVFPMSLGNQWSMYSSFTAAGWEIYSEGDPTKPGFEKQSFLDAFDFIKAAADARISVEVNGILTPGASMSWRWDDFLNADLSPFGLIGTWHDVNTAEKDTGDDFKFSRMPTWKGQQLTPFVKTKGFVINGFTKYPLACAELLKLMLSKAGMQTMIDNSSYIPVLKAKAPITPDYSNNENMKEMSSAFAHCYPEPSMNLPNNKAMPCMNVYYDIQIEQSYYDVWDGKKSAKQAQSEIVTNAAAWLEANNK